MAQDHDVRLVKPGWRPWPPHWGDGHLTAVDAELGIDAVSWFFTVFFSARNRWSTIHRSYGNIGDESDMNIGPPGAERPRSDALRALCLCSM